MNSATADARGRRKKADTGLIVSLACGTSVETAAQKAGMSVRTVYRRLADPEFVAQVNEVRQPGVAVRRLLSRLHDDASSLKLDQGVMGLIPVRRDIHD
jgi:hypothetical protein